MTQFLFPSFDELESALSDSAPRVWRLDEQRDIMLLVEPEDGAIWLQCKCEADEVRRLESTTSALEIQHRKRAEVNFALIGTRNGRIQREICLFLAALSQRLQTAPEDISDAFSAELDAWREILKTRSRLSLQEEIGLLGELLVLAMAAQPEPVAALDAWTGPYKEQHDFRFGLRDAEVKTTLSPRRSHEIASETQLVADGARKLFVISIQLKPAGAGPGLSISSVHEWLKLLWGEGSGAYGEFLRKLALLGLGADDLPTYRSTYALRTTPLAVEVGPDFPKLTRPELEHAIGPAKCLRISGVSYRVDLEGLGVPLLYSFANLDESSLDAYAK